MEHTTPLAIIIESTVQAPIDKVWTAWTEPEHITAWNFASDDWHSPHAANDLRVGGSFLSRMEAKDGSFGFDFGGVYDKVQEHELLEYTLGDGRKVSMIFIPRGSETQIVSVFEAEETNPVEMQKGGWQAILNSFKKYVEAA